MSVPAEFFAFAKLISGPDGPHPNGRQRTAVSRAYYAAFLEARDRLAAAVTFTVPKKGAHETVWKSLLYSPEPLKSLGRLLRDLKELREVADYDVHDDEILSSVAEALLISQQIRDGLATADLSGCPDPRFGPP